MSTLASSVQFEKEESVVRKIPVGAILTLAMPGVTERGPVDSTTLTFDFPDWQRTYGGYTADGFAAIVANAYFLNGGTRLRMSRIVHHTDASDPTTKQSAAASMTLQTEALAATKGSVTGSQVEPFDLEPGDDLDLNVDAGGTSTATFNATAGTETAVNTETYVLSDGQTLTVKIDGGAVQTITFNTAEFVAIGAATAAEVAAVINAEITGASADVTGGAPRITSDKRGTASSVQITGGTANAALGFPTDLNSGTGNVADIDNVTAAEVKTVVEAAVAGVTVTSVSGAVKIETNTSGSTGSIQVEASSTADDELGLDNATHSGTDAGAVNTLTVTAKSDGEWANEVSVKIGDPGSGRTGYFRFQLLRNGAVIETWDDVTMDDSKDEYIETIVNNADRGSLYVQVTDLDAPTTEEDQKPAAGTFGPMTGGDDGLAGLADTDFNGGTGLNGRVGLRTFDLHSDIDVLCSPDRATSSHHNAMVTYCDVTREGLLFAVLDPPEGNTAEQMATYVESTAALFGLTENAAIYWPRVKVLNPNKDVFGTEDKLVVPPSGHVCGVYARGDARKVGGMFEQPAGLDANYLPRGIEELETEEVKDIAKRELLFPLNVNPISQEEGTPIFLDGARNLDITGGFPSVGAARGLVFVQKRLKPALAFLRHRNLKPKLYNEGRMTVETFMDSLEEAEAFESYSIDFGPSLNTSATKAQRQIKARLGIRNWGVGEFVRVLLGPDSDLAEAA